MVDKDNKEDKTREEADMTFSPVFSKSDQSDPKLIQKMGNTWNIDFDHSRTLLDHFLAILEKNGQGVMSASSLVLSSLLSLPSTVHLPATVHNGPAVN